MCLNVKLINTQKLIYQTVVQCSAILKTCGGSPYAAQMMFFQFIAVTTILEKKESQGINVWCGLGFQDSLQAIILGMSGQEAGDTKVIDKSKERKDTDFSQKLSPFLQCSGPPAKRMLPSIMDWVFSNQITIMTIPHRHAQRPTC